MIYILVVEGYALLQVLKPAITHLAIPHLAIRLVFQEIRNIPRLMSSHLNFLMQFKLNGYMRHVRLYSYSKTAHSFVHVSFRQYTFTHSACVYVSGGTKPPMTRMSHHAGKYMVLPGTIYCNVIRGDMGYVVPLWLLNPCATLVHVCSDSNGD